MYFSERYYVTMTDEEIIARDMHPVLARWFLQADAEICPPPVAIVQRREGYEAAKNWDYDPYTCRRFVGGVWVNDEVLRAKKWPEHVTRILCSELPPPG